VNKLLHHDISSIICVPVIKELHIDLTGNRNTFLGRPASGLVTISAVPPSVTKVPLGNKAQYSAVIVMHMTIDNESRCWPLRTGFTQSLTKPFKTATNNDALQVCTVHHQNINILLSN